MTLAKFSRYYRSAALVLLNTITILVVINGLLYVAITLHYRHFHPDRDNPVLQRYLDQTWSVIYPGMSEEDIGILLRETWMRRERYSPVTQHAERAFQGKYVNVHPAGFRIHSSQQPWPVEDRSYNVFVFGGSTMFGYGVRDEDTVAANLQRMMSSSEERKVCVYNFGNSSFHSTQERARFENLLMTGQIPDMAIFVDGLNEFGIPLESDELQSVEAAYDAGLPSPLQRALEQLPMVRAGRALKRRVGLNVRRSTAAASVVADDTSQTNQLIESAIDRYLHNIHLSESAAKAYGVQTVFVWQPVPMYHYDLSRHPFGKGGFPKNRFARAGYEYFAALLEYSALGSNFLWTADMQRDLHEPLYVDKIHYSPEMNRLLAREIVSTISWTQ